MATPGGAPVTIPARRKLLYAFVLVVLALLLCEGALRVRAWIRYGSAATGVRDPMLVYDRDADLYVPRPGYEVKGAKIHIKINSLGFRGDEFARAKPPGTVRIACLGASTTFCAEVSSNQATWTARLQQKLRQAYPGVNIEVVNAAVGGYVASDNLKNLRHRVLPLDPDLVIYYEANNEIVHDTQALAAREGLIRADGARQSPFVAAMSKYSVLFDLTYKNLAIVSRSRASQGQRTLDRVPRDLPDHFISELDQMRADLAARNVPMLLSTFIVKYRRDQDRGTQIKNADVAFFYMPWMSIDGMLDAMDVYNQAILDYGARANVPVVDDRAAIPPDADHFSDCMHLLDPGAEAMADRFMRFLGSSGLIDRIVSGKRLAE
ncbi:MAG TPA: SGNH/GDSL hydrolase family protein [Vicinamibacterales bacterium]|nr:SGNH/GDSL hydrolase family protein [Vicinamibacterales bacterium]